MKISITKPGILTTIQDNGRKNYQAQAVPRSGVLDDLSARIANIAIGNDDNSATLEFTYAAAEFKAEADSLIAYAGDGAFLISEGKKLPPERPIFVPSGSTIKLTNNPEGAITYLAIAGGFDVPEILGSKSTYLTGHFGGYKGRNLQSGDFLSSRKDLTMRSQHILHSLKGNQISWPSWYVNRSRLLPADRKTIRIFPAGEFNWFDSESIINFLSKEFSVGLNSNRMGYQLYGNKISRRKNEELLSTAVCPGTIQVTGNGDVILLMADCQTTGGYPRIGQVAAVDLPLCAQLKPNDSIRFTEISRDTAEILYIEREKQLSDLKLAVASRF
ncbi:biotin-dependent carboxyltransferase family protein [Pedobacter rhodius]|uniref:Biotin-dependent carboxyltransferase family protein n=1 Tax=Pedobacter rhodius TaxID=3004098 RepID=A0ABT4KWK5_9SPHI|nr:biotin-dependent carboxyltransferase family protein [Pedobacter sp. SJ11]MCZ4222617.1 biotin-dependent carboxyltransferase family protein [Pedobacter sp. SJ11]